MELKPGYKQTELGVLPNDWNPLSIGRQSYLKARIGWQGLTTAEYLESGDYGLVTGTDFREGRIDWGGCPFVEKSRYDQDRFIQLKVGDVLVTKDGTIGKAAYIDHLPFPATLNSGVFVMRPLNDSYVPKYFFYILMSRIFTDFLNKLAAGSTISHLYQKDFVGFEFSAPPTNKEQSAIVEVLSDMDALLEGLDRLIAKKRDLKQAAMQQLLTGDTRLEGFDDEWTFRRLGDHVTFLSHGTNSRAELRLDGPVKYLHYGDIHACTLAMLEPSSLPSLPEEKAKGLDRLRDGDLVFADASEDLTGVSKSVEICGVGSTELVAGLHTIAARFDNDVLADGFKAYLQFCPVFASQLRRLAAGTKVYATNRSHIASVEMRLPSIDEQSAIAAVFHDMDTEIAALEQRRAKTADLKQAMMQELLTGKTRLVEPQASDEQTDAASGNAKGHNWPINEAVVIATLVKHFGGEDYPLGRKRYTKLSYLLHRHVEREADGYLKKAAGPYNPQTKYGGPEKIAKQNGYITQHKGPKGHSGFIAADNIAQAEGYFEKWYGPEVIQWLEQFRYKKNDDLEVLATVDMAALELRASGKSVTVAAVKDVITSHPEWEAKLDRAAFSDANIAEAIKQSDALLGAEIAGGSHA